MIKRMLQQKRNLRNFSSWLFLSPSPSCPFQHSLWSKLSPLSKSSTPPSCYLAPSLAIHSTNSMEFLLEEQQKKSSASATCKIVWCAIITSTTICLKVEVCNQIKKSKEIEGGIQKLILWKK